MKRFVLRNGLITFITILDNSAALHTPFHLLRQIPSLLVIYLFQSYSFAIRIVRPADVICSLSIALFLDSKEGTIWSSIHHDKQNTSRTLLLTDPSIAKPFPGSLTQRDYPVNNSSGKWYLLLSLSYVVANPGPFFVSTLIKTRTYDTTTGKSKTVPFNRIPILKTVSRLFWGESVSSRYAS